MLSEELLRKGLRTNILGCQIESLETVDSTNTRAKFLAEAGAAEGTVVLAEDQTAGRGRLGRTWISEPMRNLLFSFIVRPQIQTGQLGWLPFFAAAGTALALESVTGQPCECKWPNDVLLNGKKCCGILLESSIQRRRLDYAVIGIGININQREFAGSLGARATSLLRECSREFDRAGVFRQVMISLESLYEDVRKGDFESSKRTWEGRSRMFGRAVTLLEGSSRITGVAAGLADDGGLVLETASGRRVVHAGDVTLAA